MRRLIGALLILHGFAHLGVGMWVYGVDQRWWVTGLWLISVCGFFAAGAGLQGIPSIERRWHGLVVIAAVASLGLIALFRRPDPVLVFGSGIDAAILIASIPFVREALPRWVGTPVHPAHRRLSSLGAIVLAVALAYPVALILLRPWQTRWGVTRIEIAAAYPGDERGANARYRLDHGVTIHAPASAVWPWLVQIGQDRAGFYSYDWLERLIGDPVHNADRIVPAWQSLHPGDLVRAAPPDYLGGLFGHELGWRVVSAIPNRALILDGWGAFVLDPVNDTTTRLVVRTRGAGIPSFIGIPLAPVNIMVFEPAHFIMQRRMLLGIAERAEREWRESRGM